MVDAGASLAARDDAGYTALHFAAEFGQPTAAQALVTAGASLLEVDGAGMTPQEVAVEHVKLDVLKVFEPFLEKLAADSKDFHMGEGGGPKRLRMAQMGGVP